MSISERPKFLMAVIIALLLLNFGTLTFMWLHKPPPPPREGRGHEGPREGGGPAMFIEHELNLNEQQRQEFKKLRDEHHQKVEELREKMGEERHQLFDLIATNDTAKANELTNAISMQEREIDRITFAHFQQVRALCNPEQQKHFDQIIQEILRMMIPPQGR